MFKSRQFFNQIASLADGLIFIPFVLSQWFALDCHFIHIMDGASGSYACTRGVATCTHGRTCVPEKMLKKGNSGFICSTCA